MSFLHYKVSEYSDTEVWQAVKQMFLSKATEKVGSEKNLRKDGYNLLIRTACNIAKCLKKEEEENKSAK